MFLGSAVLGLIALAKLIEIITPQPDDTVVPLGDYVDRGIDNRGVIDQLMALAGRCRLVPILGMDLGYLKCFDTRCCHGGWLTALDVDSGQVWQVNERGEVRGVEDLPPSSIAGS
jgi:hypothetical protein